VVFVSSLHHFLGFGKLDHDSYSKKPGISNRTELFGFLSGEMIAYADHKLMNILTANEFNKRFSKNGIESYANSVCPGFVYTNFQANLQSAIPSLGKILTFISSKIARNQEEGAGRILILLTDPQFEHRGGIFIPSFPIPISSFEINEKNEKWLFEKSNEFLGLDNK